MIVADPSHLQEDVLFALLHFMPCIAFDQGLAVEISETNTADIVTTWNMW